MSRSANMNKSKRKSLARNFKNAVYVDVTRLGADDYQIESLARMIGVRMSESIRKGPDIFGNCIIIDVKVEEDMTHAAIERRKSQALSTMSSLIQAELVKFDLYNGELVGWGTN